MIMLWVHSRRRLIWRAIVAGLFGLWGASTTLAQTVTVQSGEHAGFTRLVLDIGATRDWRLDAQGDRVRLVLDPPVDGFDITRVFDMIPQTRLAALAVDDGLELTLACECVVVPERFRDRYLVLDIRAGQRPPAPVAADETPAQRPLAQQLPDMTRILLESRGSVAQPVLSEPLGAEPLAAASLTDVDLQAAARIMAEQLARASAAGLLDAAAGRPMSDADPLPATVVPPTASPPPPPEPDPASQAARPILIAPPVPSVPIRAETAFDMAVPRVVAAVPSDVVGRCVGEAINIADWAMGATIQSGLGALRLALYDPRDQLQPEAVLALARHYLAFGFGAEAAFWLNQINNPPKTLLALSALVDEGPGPQFPPEPEFLGCSDSELLWRYLDGALISADLTLEEAGRLQRATVALPQALFDQIAPRVARALHADGFDNEARNLRDLLWRGGRIPSGALLWLDRDLGLSLTDDATAQTVLATALRDSAGDPVTAMAHAMAFDRDRGAPMNGERLDAAEALLREYGIGQITADLWQEIVLAQARRGDLDRLLGLLAERDIADATWNDTVTLLLADRLAAQDTATVFLVARLFGTRWQAEGSTAGRVQVAAIAYLREAGLGHAADDLRSGQRLLILPAPLTDAANSTQDDNADLRRAWQGGDWRRVAESASGAHRDIAARMLATAPDNATTSNPDALVRDLGRLADHVADSQALRAEIAALLATSAPVAAEPVP